MARSNGVACVYDPRSGQERHINEERVNEGGSTPAAVVAISCGGDGDRFPVE